MVTPELIQRLDLALSEKSGTVEIIDPQAVGLAEDTVKIGDNTRMQLVSERRHTA